MLTEKDTGWVHLPQFGLSLTPILHTCILSTLLELLRPSSYPGDYYKISGKLGMSGHKIVLEAVRKKGLTCTHFGLGKNYSQ